MVSLGLIGGITWSKPSSMPSTVTTLFCGRERGKCKDRVLYPSFE